MRRAELDALESSPSPSPSRRTSYSQRYVQSLFDGIAGRYDLLNHTLSIGFDVFWRRKAVDALRPHHPKHILDLATGTGDFAIAAARLDPQRIVGIDIATSMLTIGRSKVAARGLEHLIRLDEGSAEAIPFSDGSFDAVIVAFGVRNFSHLDRALDEMARVLRPGGKMLVLEFSHPRCFPVRQLYAAYSKSVLPAIGGLLSSQRDAYEYLPRTIGEFPDGEDFLALVRKHRLLPVSTQELTAGIVTVYLAEKPSGVQKKR